MFAVHYRWTLRPGSEPAFRAAWCAMTEAIRAAHGTHGSRLHRTDDGDVVAYAVWPSRQAWERARAQPSADPAAGAAMRELIAHAHPPVPLEITDDLVREAHVEPTRQALQAVAARGIAGAVVMLNLLRFRAEADYRAAPELAPPAPISGAEAYSRYLELARPFVEAVGGELAFTGRGGTPLIGPPGERWDAVLLVRYPSLAAFFAFATDAGYLRVVPHRHAALEDSRLLPITDT